jgi:hypothetical protein
MVDSQCVAVPVIAGLSSQKQTRVMPAGSKFVASAARLVKT